MWEMEGHTGRQIINTWYEISLIVLIPGHVTEKYIKSRGGMYFNTLYIYILDIHVSKWRELDQKCIYILISLTIVF